MYINPMKKIHILLIEDNRLLREGIASMLEKQQDFEVIARSDNGDALSELKDISSSLGINMGVRESLPIWKKSEPIMKQR